MKKKILCGVGAFIVVFLTGFYIYEKSQSDQSLENTLTSLGVSYKLIGDELIIAVDQARVRDNGDLLAKSGLYSSGITKDYILKHPVFVSSMNAVTALSLIIINIYKNSYFLKEINISAYLLHPDIYGVNKKYLIFSCTFDRDLYKKINWKNFSISNTINVLPNFQTTQWLENEYKREASMS